MTATSGTQDRVKDVRGVARIPRIIGESLLFVVGLVFMPVRIVGAWWVIGFFVLVLLPIAPWTNIYCPVSAKARYWGDVPDNQWVRTKSWLGVDDPYVVDQGRLFLRVQSTRPSLVLMWADTRRWNASALADLVKTHRDLRALLPDPDAADGGIGWLHRRRRRPYTKRPGTTLCLDDTASGVRREPNAAATASAFRRPCRRPSSSCSSRS